MILGFWFPVDFIHSRSRSYYLFFTTCSLTICMCVRFGTKIRGDVFGLVQIYPLCVFGLVLENSLESHKPVENQQLRLLTIPDGEDT